MTPSDYCANPSTSTTRFYASDGHGNVRELTDATGAVTDTYAYDAFGNLVAKSGSTSNNYLYCGEQYDPDLGLYYNRARYLNTDSGRFWSRDSFEGSRGEPMSLHKYNYAFGNPVDGTDPSGNFSLVEVMQTVGVVGTLTLIANVGITSLGASAAMADADGQPDAAIASVSEVGSTRGASASVGFDVVLDFKSGRTYAYANFSAGLAPLSYFKAFRNVVSPSVTAGLIWNLNAPDEWSGGGLTATWPGSVSLILAKTLGRTNPMWGALSQLAKREHNVKVSDYVVQIGVSTSGPAALKLGLRNNSFGAEAGIASDPIDLTGLGEAAGDLLSKVNIGALGSLRGGLDALPSIVK